MSKIKLTEACNIVTGKLDANAAEKKGKYPYFTCAPEPLAINTFAFDDDVILLAGNNASGKFHCQRYKGKFNAYQRTYVITAKQGYDIEYIYYNLKINLQNLKKIAQGSQTKFLTMQILDGFQIEDIPLQEQVKATEILAYIDEKIENNSKINIELESMAKTIYDYWFLQCEFPNGDGKPYKSSGGKMVWNEELKREIPEGWRRVNLNDIASITMGTSPKGNSINTDGKGIAFYQGKADFGSRFPITRTYTDEPIRYADVNDILLSVRAPVGTLNIANEKCCIGRGLAVIHSEYTSFLFYLMRANQYRFDSYNYDGTTFGAITKDDLFGMSIVIPKEDIIDKFEKEINCIDRKIFKCERETQELISLRDFLLPLLMNGQIGFKA